MYRVYLGGAALVAAVFADYARIAYHFAQAQVVSGEWIALLYVIAMVVGGGASLLFGRLFDRHGFGLLIALTVVGALFAPLVLLGGFGAALAGAAVWGMGMGVHESIIPAAVAPLVSAQRGDRRAVRALARGDGGVLRRLPARRGAALRPGRVP